MSLDSAALATLFTEARTHSKWLDRPVNDEVLAQLFELAKIAPTSANSNPGRVVFVKSAEAKEKLRPALMPMNVDKTMSAPVTAIIAFDTRFHLQMPKLFPARPDYATRFADMVGPARDAFTLQNGSLFAGYFVLAARALGLDCGPMGGFDRAKVDDAFLGELGWKSLLLINLGYGDESGLFPRNPRLSFEDAARIV
ncbi:MAG TPA: malonic semialdehyde reductase [Polyangiaceae bacterium]